MQLIYKPTNINSYSYIQTAFQIVVYITKSALCSFARWYTRFPCEFYFSLLYFIFQVCHAELNAVLNKNSSDVADCTIYVALFPCNECAKIIIQSGITEVVYYSDKYYDREGTKAAKRMFELAGVKYRYINSLSNHKSNPRTS